MYFEIELKAFHECKKLHENVLRKFVLQNSKIKGYIGTTKKQKM